MASTAMGLDLAGPAQGQSKWHVLCPLDWTLAIRLPTNQLLTI